MIRDVSLYLPPCVRRKTSHRMGWEPARHSLHHPCIGKTHVWGGLLVRHVWRALHMRVPHIWHVLVLHIPHHVPVRTLGESLPLPSRAASPGTNSGHRTPPPADCTSHDAARYPAATTTSSSSSCPRHLLLDWLKALEGSCQLVPYPTCRRLYSSCTGLGLVAFRSLFGHAWGLIEIQKGTRGSFGRVSLREFSLR
jgi:hypothetical protein